MEQTEVGWLRLYPVALGKLFNARAFSPGEQLSFPNRNKTLVAAAVVFTAVMIGLAIGKGHWIYLLPVAFMVCVLFWPVAVALGSFALLIPFDNASAISGIARTYSVTTAVGVVATLVMVVAGLAGRRFSRPPKSALWWGLFTGWGLLTILWAADPQIALRHLPAALSLVILYMVTVSLRIDEKELTWIFVSAILGGALAAAIGSYQFYHGIFSAVDASRGSLVMGVESADPNIFAATLLLPLALVIGYFLSARGWARKLMTAALSAVLVLGVLVSMSRSAFVAVIVIVLFYLYRFPSRRKMLGALAFLFLPLLASPHSFFTRLENAAGGAGRLDIWSAGLMSLKKYGLWGAGFDNFYSVYYSVAGYAPHFMGYSRDSHNTYLEIGVDLGILGLVFFFAAMVTQMREVARRDKSLPASVSVIACEAACWAVIVCALFGNLTWRKFFWLPWMLLAVSVRIRNEQQVAVKV